MLSSTIAAIVQFLVPISFSPRINKSACKNKQKLYREYIALCMYNFLRFYVFEQSHPSQGNILQNSRTKHAVCDVFRICNIRQCNKHEQQRVYFPSRVTQWSLKSVGNVKTQRWTGSRVKCKHRHAEWKNYKNNRSIILFRRISPTVARSQDEIILQACNLWTSNMLNEFRLSDTSWKTRQQCGKKKRRNMTIIKKNNVFMANVSIMQEMCLPGSRLASSFSERH